MIEVQDGSLFFGAQTQGDGEARGDVPLILREQAPLAQLVAIDGRDVPVLMRRFTESQAAGDAGDEG